MAGVVAFVDDLMFVSRILEAAKGASVEVRTARQVAQVVAACDEGARLVIMDLDSPRLDTAGALAALQARAVPVPVIGFFSHVDVEKARRAQAAGCQTVLPRSAFVQKLPTLLAEPQA